MTTTQSPEEAAIHIEKHYQYCFGSGQDKYAPIENADPAILGIIQAQRDAAVEEAVKQSEFEIAMLVARYHELEGALVLVEEADYKAQQIARLTAEVARLRGIIEDVLRWAGPKITTGGGSLGQITNVFLHETLGNALSPSPLVEAVLLQEIDRKGLTDINEAALNRAKECDNA